MKVIITKPLDKSAKEVIIATVETIKYHLELLHEQTNSASHIKYTFLNPSYLLTGIWMRKEFLEKTYGVKILKD